MAIKASSAGQIASLIAHLGSDRAVVREAAIARLTVLGPRAVDRLVGVVDSETSSMPRAAALRALEAIADPRALDHVLAATAASDTVVATAAVAASRPFLRGAQGVKVVDRLTRLVMDAKRNDLVRIAGLQALRQLEPSTVTPLLTALKEDKSAAIRAEVGTRAAASSSSPLPLPHAELLERAAQHGLPDEPDELLDALTTGGQTVPLSTLLRIIEGVREREAKEAPEKRALWARLRGRVHAVLAGRHSRIALYDLRESLETTNGPLAVEFLAALSLVGDRGCLPAIAAAYAHAGATEDTHDWWRGQLADAFGAIVRREKLTRRHAVLQKIETRWQGVVDALLP